MSIGPSEVALRIRRALWVNNSVCKSASPAFTSFRARTKAICPVHYAGMACEMDKIMAIAANHNLLVIEDAAQGVMSSYKGRPLGQLGLANGSVRQTKEVMLRWTRPYC